MDVIIEESTTSLNFCIIQPYIDINDYQLRDIQTSDYYKIDKLKITSGEDAQIQS